VRDGCRKVHIQEGGETGGQHRWPCLSCGKMGPWTSQTSAVISGEAHADRHRNDAHEPRHRDEDLDEILQNLALPIASDAPPKPEN
jgi:hypothetical protein